jgi:hypothetical protein
MTRKTSVAAAAIIAALLLATASTPVRAQGGTANKRTFLTFSGAVQVPGATLPAGTYVFRMADPASQTIWQVLDGRERNVLTTFFDVPSPRRTTQDQNRAGGKPVVTFRETPQGIPPAIRFLYYPTDLYGSELIYPKDQAQLIANATRQPVLATTSDATKGGAATIITVEPETTEARNNGASAETATPAEPAPQAANEESRPAATSGGQSTESNQPVGTSGRTEGEAQPVGTSGRAEGSGTAGQAARADLPATASPLPAIGLVGLLALLGGIGIGFARRATTR